MPPDRTGKWRSKWKRSAPERRLAAAASMADVFAARRRTNWILLVLLVLSVAGHAVLFPVLTKGRNEDLAALAGEDSYLDKVMAKQRARTVSKKMVGQITMPPAPPDPKGVVSDVLTGTISTDIGRTIGDLLDVNVTDKLTAQVTASLKDELVAAAENIAAGKYSEEDIRRLQEEFKTKAHERTVQALQKHREDTQVAHAQLSVKEWYETRLSATLKRRMDEEMFSHYHRAFWERAWCFWNGFGWLEGEGFRRKVGSLGSLSRGTHYDPTNRIGGTPTEHGQRMLPDWPKVTDANVAGLQTVLAFIRDGGEGHASFESVLKRYVDDFHPHRRKEADAKAARIRELFDRAGAEAAACAEKVADGAPEAECLAARAACLKTIGELSKAGSALLVDGQLGGQYAAVNQAVRSRVLRGPRRDEMYEKLVDEIQKLFEAPVRDVAENEFREGIIIRETGVEEARAKFTQEILSMLRKDVQEVIPRPRFEDLVFTTHYPHSPYISEVTGQHGPPSAKDIVADEARLAATVKDWSEQEKAYIAARGEVIEAGFAAATERIAATLGERLIEEGRFGDRFYASVESVDYTDKVQQRLQARRRAMEGRGQDLARLTDEGIPDTSAPLIALMFGASKGHGASLEPVMTTMRPRFYGQAGFGMTFQAAEAVFPPRPRSWDRVTQHEPQPPFEHYKCEGIPFLANFPSLDGDLSDWGHIRPLITQKIRWINCPDQELMVYAAWNYQGYFFGWHVDQKEHLFCLPQDSYADHTGMVFHKASGYRWAYTGDNLRLLFDTLDARSDLRGEPHTQEFVIFPRGTESNPNIPGIERIIRSARDATRRRQEWGEIIADTKVFPPQPPLEVGPDGTGPYRVTKFGKEGYTCEVFVPRTLFSVPVFAPGWYIGFETVVGIGDQRGNHGGVWGRLWANKVWNGHGELGDKDFPKDWGDLLLLGTDPQVTVQQAAPGWPVARAVTPGHSYLLTVADPDRNVNLTAEDTVIVSAEVAGGRADADDVEVYILKETGKNTSIFRGCIDTQPGRGRQVQGVLEIAPGQTVRFGYVDFGNAKGQRNVIYEARLPVVAPVVEVVSRAK